MCIRDRVDRPELCDFTVPSILERGEIVAAVGSGGAAPVLAKRVRTQLEALMPQNMGPLSVMAKAFRPAVYEALNDGTARRQFWEAALNGKPAELAMTGKLKEAKLALETLLQQFANNDRLGDVHIVGAGPGDPELLTLKAFRLIQNADIVFHDRLVDVYKRQAETLWARDAEFKQPIRVMMHAKDRFLSRCVRVHFLSSRRSSCCGQFGLQALQLEAMCPSLP